MTSTLHFGLVVSNDRRSLSAGSNRYLTNLSLHTSTDSVYQMLRACEEVQQLARQAEPVNLTVAFRGPMPRPATVGKLCTMLS